MSLWEKWVEEAHAKLESRKLIHSLRPIYLQNQHPHHPSNMDDQLQLFDEMHPWDRASVDIQISEATLYKWLHEIPSSGDEADSCRDGSAEAGTYPQGLKKLTSFCGNDYLALSSHPSITKTAAKAILDHGMGPRGSSLVSGYTNYHRSLESYLANLKEKEDCLLCPTGFAANMAAIVAIGKVGSLLASGSKPLEHEKIAIFSDALNHASIVDGIRLSGANVYVYRHSDMTHLDSFLSNCTLTKKVVVTDSLFSVDGDFAPLTELVKLREKYGFLLVIDDAHGVFVCGKNDGGVSDQFNCEKEIDICIGTLSKAAGCQGGFIACSQKWKQLIQSTGRSFMFSTGMPVPFAAAAYAAVIVARKETWRRQAIWDRIQDFHDLTGIPVTSHIVSLVIGSEVRALEASRHLLNSGFHVVAIRPPVVPPNSCRLRVCLSAAHTRKDMERFVAALSSCMNFKDIAF